MSSSGLIYALIVGAWAVYLVPIWLRREDELNAARETERFATAIRVLGHREAAVRRAVGSDVIPDDLIGEAGVLGVLPDASTAHGAVPGAEPELGARSRGVAKPAASAPETHALDRNRRTTGAGGVADARARGRRGRLVARRRRVVATLLALSLVGVVSTAVLGVDFLWLTGVPGVLFVAYAVHVRHDERRRLSELEARRRRLDAERRRRAAELAAQAEADRAEAERVRVEHSEEERVRVEQATAAARRQRPIEPPVPTRVEPQTARGRRRPVRPVASPEYVDRPRAVGE